MDRESLQAILENLIDIVQCNFLRIEGPKFKEIKDNDFEVEVKFFINGIKVPCFISTYKIDLNKKSDEDIFQAIGESFIYIKNMVAQLVQYIQVQEKKENKETLSYIR